MNKIINPEEYLFLLIDTYFRESVSIPMFIATYADIIMWEENKYIRMINYREGFGAWLKMRFLMKIFWYIYVYRGDSNMGI